MIVYIKPSLLGDTILVEPAMTAWSKAHGGERVKLLLDSANLPYRCLFEYNPAIEIIPYRDKHTREEEVIRPDASDAFWAAHHRRLPFAAGHLPAFGMEPDASWDRLHYRLFGLPKPSRNLKYVCLCPNARSCVNSIDPSKPPNIKATPEWWVPILEFILEKTDHDVYTIGPDDGMKLDGATNYCGKDFRAVAEFMNDSSLIISVETGLLHLAGGIPDGPPIIFLSSATPIEFCAPIGSMVARATTPGATDFPQEQVIEFIGDALGGK